MKDKYLEITAVYVKTVEEIIRIEFGESSIVCDNNSLKIINYSIYTELLDPSTVEAINSLIALNIELIAIVKLLVKLGYKINYKTQLNSFCSILEAGYVFAPYVPLVITELE